MKEETKCYCGHTTTCDCGPEETKQECMITKSMQMDAEMAYDSLPKQDKIMERFIANVEQETLEEAAETVEEYFLSNIKNMLQFNNDALAIRFMEKYYHAKKEEERSYSEEDLKDAFQSGFTNGFNINSVTFDEWFEQFNKK
jgi:hypothetical protein